MSAAPGSVGLFAALKNTAATVLGMAQTRLALIGNEIQVEKHRVLKQLVFAVAAMFFVALSVLLVVALTTMIFWEQRVVVVAGFGLLFMGLAVYFYQSLLRSTESSEAMFATSLSELQKDLAQLKRMTDRTGDVP